METNHTLELLRSRTSTRTYSNEPITDSEKTAILEAAFRAPTAGNMMLYSIIEITEQATKDHLAVTCDDQPFIAAAPWVLIFVADYRKWTDLFEATARDTAEPVRPPGPGDLLLACSDALIAAQNAVIAAESLGIGSCYIGDVLENGEAHAGLLGLPAHTLPVAMLCLGRPAKRREPVVRYTSHVVHRDRYRRLTPPELEQTSRELGALHTPHGLPEGDSYPQAVRRRKYDSDFMAEMNRSVTWWLERWRSGDS